MYSIFSLIFVGCFLLKVCSPNDSYEVAAQTMTDPPPSLTPGSKNTVGRAASWLFFFFFFLALTKQNLNQIENKNNSSNRIQQFLLGGVEESGFEGNVM